jgi:hypothetical protein
MTQHTNGKVTMGRQRRVEGELAQGNDQRGLNAVPINLEVNCQAALVLPRFDRGPVIVSRFPRSYGN